MRRTPGILLVVVITLFSGASIAGADGSTPTVSGPVTGGNGNPSLVSTTVGLADAGYEIEEYFLEGTATAYEPAAPLRSHGKWKVTKGETAPYKTRVVVYRPIDADDFNGTVFVEWINVSAGFDTAPDWLTLHTQIIRSGAGYMACRAEPTSSRGRRPVASRAAIPRATGR
jgi:hypothetical protein